MLQKRSEYWNLNLYNKKKKHARFKDKTCCLFLIKNHLLGFLIEHEKMKIFSDVFHKPRNITRAFTL